MRRPGGALARVAGQKLGTKPEDAGGGPDGGGDEETLPGTDTIQPAAEEQEAERVAGLEGGGDVAVEGGAELKLIAEDRGEGAEEEPVEVVDGCRREEEGQHEPAFIRQSGTLRRRGGRERGSVPFRGCRRVLSVAPVRRE